jgi:hypothetical protein
MSNGSESGKSGQRGIIMAVFKQFRKRILFWVAQRLPACEDIIPLISAARDRKLTWKERISVRLHLAVCSLCRRYANQLEYLHQAMHQHAQHIEQATATPNGHTYLPDEARERMRRMLSSNE